MNPRVRAVAITAAAAALPFFTGTIWWRFVHGIPFPIALWGSRLVPPLLAAFLAAPAGMRRGVLVQAVATGVLMGFVPYGPVSGAVVILIGAALGWFLTPAGPRSDAPPPSSPDEAPVSRGRGAAFVALALLVVAGLGAGGFFAWRAMTRIDRALEELGTKGYTDPETFVWLAERGDDPRVHGYFVGQLDVIARGGFALGDLGAMDRAFAKKKPGTTDERAVAVVELALGRDVAGARSWLDLAWDDPRMTKAVVKRLVDAAGSWHFPDAKLDALIAECERRKVPAPEVTDAIAKLHVQKRGVAGGDWLEAHAKEPACRAALLRETFSALGSLSPSEADHEKRLEFLLATAKKWATTPEPAVLEGFVQLYLRTPPRACDDVVRALGPDAARLFRERSAREPAFHERHVCLVLACLAGGGAATDVPALVSPLVSPPVLIEDDLRKLEQSGFSPAPLARAVTEPWFFEATRRALLAIGKPAVAQLASGISCGSRAAVRLCAAALVALDPDALVGAVEEKIDAYNAKAPLLAVACEVLTAREAGADRARAIVREAWPLAEAVAEGLLALEKVGLLSAEGTGTDRVDLCFMRGLSCTDEAVAEHCAGVLRKRLDRDRFVDVLFRFLAHKASFDVREVAVYEEALKAFGTAASPAICRNLEHLLEKGRGDPARVYWIHKVIALRCLVAVGDKAAVPTVEKYAKDPGAYVHVETRTDPKTKKVTDRKETKVPFKRLCDEALAAIAGRK